MTRDSLYRICLLIFVTLIPVGCSPTRSHLAECQYEIEKLLVDYKPQFQVEHDLKVGGLIHDCMRAQGFEFNTTRSNANSENKKYIGYVGSITDEGNWDRWWWAQFTHEKSK